jgi:hypothetical protein
LSATDLEATWTSLATPAISLDISSELAELPIKIATCSNRRKKTDQPGNINRSLIKGGSYEKQDQE